MTSGEGDMRSDPRSLGPQRFFGYLNENFLAFVQQVLDLEGSIQIQRLLFLAQGYIASIIFPGAHQYLQVVKVLMDVGDVEEGCFIQADVHESGLHTREDPYNPSLIDIAADSLVGSSL